MTSEWRYALKPLPVDSAAKELAAMMDSQSAVAGVSVAERMDRIVRGLRARVTEPELQQDGWPDDGPSKRS